MSIAILVIAAGASRRLGQAKQLLRHRNTFLLHYILDECVVSRLGDVHLVLGANRAQIQTKIDLNIPIYFNNDWSEGMGKSIAFGMQQIMQKNYDGVIVTVGDQPFFDQYILKELVLKQKEKQAKIVISTYSKGAGTPCYFDKSLFAELCQLRSDIGAKPIIKKYHHLVERIDFPKGHIDIDTTADLKYLQ
jgi:molybdenum cofactor cytidylyltransferase